jgi:hypothetical protein
MVGALVISPFVTTGGGVATALASPSQPKFGSSVYIFNAGMPQSQIQATVDAIATQQVPNQFGTQRYALLFEPGTYGSSTKPLNFQVGYYTEVAGLGLSPNDVTINGSVYARNQCSGGQCTALVNFWRSLSNLTINVTTPGFGCSAANSGRSHRRPRCAESTSTGLSPSWTTAQGRRMRVVVSSPIRSSTAAWWSTGRSSRG